MQNLRTLNLPIELKFTPKEAAETPINVLVRTRAIQTSIVSENTEFVAKSPNSGYLKMNLPDNPFNLKMFSL